MISIRRGVARRLWLSRVWCRALTLFELLVVLVMIAILVGFALPRYYDRQAAAKEAADITAIDGINAALRLAYIDHRMTEAPASFWIDDVTDIANILHHARLPDGITCADGRIIDQRGNRYRLTKETASSTATIEPY